MNLKRRNYATLTLLFIYTITLTWILLFKMEFSISSIYRFRSINLIPFNRPTITNGTIYFNEIIYNFIIFIPAGIYISMLKKGKTFISKVLPIIIYSFVIELVQYILSIGASDITDLLGNSLGGAAGIATYYGLSKLLKDKTDKFCTIISIIFLTLFFSLVIMIYAFN